MVSILVMSFMLVQKIFKAQFVRIRYITIDTDTFIMIAKIRCYVANSTLLSIPAGSLIKIITLKLFYTVTVIVTHALRLCNSIHTSV